jgi:phosphatidate phosphatase APP1
MSNWKELLTSAATTAEAGFDRLKEKLFGRLDADKPYRIVYYRGFGSPSAVWLKGRVLRERDLSTPSDRDTYWNNLLATYQRFETDEVPNVTVKVDAFGQTHTIVTDEEGYFELTINPPNDLPPGRVWFPVTYSLDGLTQPTTGEPVRKEGYLMISPSFSQFGVISDIDDTVLVTGATSLLQTARLTF